MAEIGLRKEELDTPILWVDLGTMEANIAALAAHFKHAGVAWRPHTKGMKIPAVAHKTIKAGAIGVTCAKLGEAEVMAAAGISDILVANQVVTPQKLARLAGLQRHSDVKVAVDSEANIIAIGRAATTAGVEIGVLIELDTGMARAGVQPGKPVVELAFIAEATAGVRFLGVMAWEGHACDMQHEEAKRSEIMRSVAMLTSSAELCRQADLPVRIVSGGGSGTYLITPFLPGVTEIQAGGAIFCDPTYQSWGVQTTPALFVRATVVSRPTPERIIFDCGFKTMPGWAGMPKPIGLPKFISIAMSAEHATVILQVPDSTIQVGDAYDFQVGYGDATVFLHDQMYGIRAGVVEVIWPILARGKLK